MFKPCHNQLVYLIFILPAVANALVPSIYPFFMPFLIFCFVVGSFVIAA